jgi:carbonic anhydrase
VTPRDGLGSRERRRPVSPVVNTPTGRYIYFSIKFSRFAVVKRKEAPVPIVDEVLAANEKYASGFTKGELPMPPGRKLAVVACMDARLDPAKALGLEEGDAHVIRNAGGRAADALRSLVISQQLLGTTDVIVIHHTDCGMLTFDNATLQGICQERLGADASEIDFLPFGDVEQSVRDDVEVIRSSPLIPNEIAVRGFIYDVKTGKLQEVA